MKTGPWLLIDATFLCHRAFYAGKDRDFIGQDVAVIHGFLRSVVELENRFQTNRVAFCFDGLGDSKRQLIYGRYKSQRKKERKEETHEEMLARRSMYRQMSQLKLDLLKKIGFRNVFAADGYEADDLIASLIINLNEPSVIVGSDSDLHQLINEDCSCWNPITQKLLTNAGFQGKWDLNPFHWGRVKAIAGCVSDSIKGVRGIGEKTACKYIAGKLKPGSKAHQWIEQGKERIERNLKLTCLPFPGTLTLELREDEVTAKRWRRVIGELGLDNLNLKPPVLS